MSRSSAVELDFFQMERQSSLKPHPQPTNKLFDRRRSFRDIQSVISKMNPELLKSVIASGSAAEINSNVAKSPENGDVLASKPSFSVPSTPKHEETPFPALPLLSTPAFGNNTSGFESATDTTPLTIFYKGTVAVFDLPRHKAENIFKFAHEEKVPKNVQLLDTLNRDLPIARQKSLQRFLEKRKERITLVSPYGCPTDYAFSGQKTLGQ